MAKEPSLHSVVVGNVGTVYAGDNKREAHRAFTEYVLLSKEPYGRAAGEDVTWFTDGDIAKEYIGTLDDLSDCACKDCR